jgi:SAM-dependent methyltransferase
MQENFLCPACNSDDWRFHKTFVYRSGEAGGNASNQQSEYISLRQRVLFEVWFPEAGEVALKAQYCVRCGFMCYSPRPEAKDLAAKYEFLGSRENIGGSNLDDPEELRLDRKRADRLLKTVSKYVHPLRSVLDVGGGDGKLLAPFVEKGIESYLLDFNTKPRFGITRLGSTWNDLPEDKRFDCIICSHVLEHVDNPVQFIRSLLSHLAPEGKAYLEVPGEIWEGIPIQADPVTHINFFTKTSLKNVFQAAGGRCLAAKETVGTYGKWRIPIIWAIVAKGISMDADAFIPGGDHTRTLLEAGGKELVLRKLWIEPRTQRSLTPVLHLTSRVLRKGAKALRSIRSFTGAA